MELTTLIATSLKRTDWLVDRSLRSVYQQKGVDVRSIGVLIIDDNKDEKELDNIISQVNNLRISMNLIKTDFPTRIIRNKRTPFMSGTGAWNTGLIEIYNQYPDGFVSILDDDDEYLPNHLFDCIREIDNETIAVFQRLYWKNENGTRLHFNFTIDDLTPENFFIGNPGIQGSNMLFKISQLIAINGFDESLPNTTDRDLMIRFLWNFQNSMFDKQYKIKVLENIGVVHYNHKGEKVNNDVEQKHVGLNRFYKKYKAYFSEKDYAKSISRAKQLFNYTPVEE